MIRLNRSRLELKPRARPSTCLLAGLAALALVIGAAGSGQRALAAPPAQEGQAIVTSPAANSQLVGVIQVTGSATHPQFLRYELAWSPEPVSGDAWAVFASIEAPIENGVLGTWNTAQAPDGLYSLRLRVVRQDGNYSETVIPGLRIANSQPVQTPTPPPGPTILPEPTGQPITPSPELIIQPPTSTPQPPTPTPASSGAVGSETSSRLNPTSFNINLGVLGDAFCRGITYTFGIFIAWGLALSVRGLARWALRQIARQQGKEKGM